MSEPDLEKARGMLLRDLRHERHMTLRVVSEKSGLALGFISDVERAKRDPSTLTLVSLLGVLGVSLPVFLRLLADRLDGKPVAAARRRAACRPGRIPPAA